MGRARPFRFGVFGETARSRFPEKGRCQRHAGRHHRPIRRVQADALFSVRRQAGLVRGTHCRTRCRDFRAVPRRGPAQSAAGRGAGGGGHPLSEDADDAGRPGGSPGYCGRGRRHEGAGGAVLGDRASPYARAAGYFEQQTRRETLRLQDPEQAADQFWGMVLGYFQLQCVVGLREAPGPEEIEAFVRSAVAWFLDGCRANKG